MTPMQAMVPRFVAAVFALAVIPTAAVHAQKPLLGELHRMFPPSPVEATCAAAGDVDADGDIDLLVAATHYVEQRHLYLNDGRGCFVDVTATNLPVLPVGADDTIALAFADVDGDGDLDAYFGAWDQDHLYLNDGAGVFTDVTAARLPIGSQSTWGVAFGDVDGDGDLDIVLGHYGRLSSGQNRLYQNDGAGTFHDVTATHLPVVGDYTKAVALVDVDADGDLDVVFANDNGEQDRLCVNDGTGRFSDVTASRMPVDADGGQDVTSGDVDGDGDPDLLIANGYDPNQQDRLYLNDGLGVFTDVTSTNLPAVVDDSRRLALGDVDGDGDLDALIGNSGTDRLYLNDGTGRFVDATSPNLPVGAARTRALSLQDVDGDGDLDAVITRYCDTCLLLNDGAGVFADVTSVGPPSVDHSGKVSVGDLDGDGDLDVMLGTAPGAPLAARICLNDGTASFADVSATHLPVGSGGTVDIALGDVDGDGDLDAVLLRAAQSLLYENDGAGVFSDVTATRLPPNGSNEQGDAVFGDVDGDADLDLVIADRFRQNRLFLNSGAGVFSDVTSTHMPRLDDISQAVALVDVDGDGDPDLLVANRYQQNRLYLNDGTGVFSDATAGRLPPDSDVSNALAVGDVDGDGDPDVLIGNTQQNRLYLNDGAGFFTDAPTNIPADLDETFAVELVDLDGDGDLDAFIGNWMRRHRLYLNDGAGRFVWAYDGLLVPFTTCTLDVSAGDLDHDGDADLVVGNRGTNLVLTNLTRQVAWRVTPRVGVRLTMDVYGPPGQAYLLDAALARVSIPLPPYGAVFVDPNTVVLVALGLTDPRGHGVVELEVPDDPALRGARIYWQAIVMCPMRLTNLEVTELADF